MSTLHVLACVALAITSVHSQAALEFAVSGCVVCALKCSPEVCCEVSGCIEVSYVCNTRL